MTSTPAEHSNWTKAVAGSAARDTHLLIRDVLKSSQVWNEYSLDVFLQGSYANHTNIRAGSDVDIVVMSRQAPTLGLSGHSVAGLRFKIHSILIEHFGLHRVDSKNRCIRVYKSPGYVDADVVPCFHFNERIKSNPNWTDGFIEGIVIQPVRGAPIKNYPKAHKKNGEDKNDHCHGLYKMTVRQVKHLRNRAVSEGRLEKDEAPGYLLECMLFNVSKEYFVLDDSQRLRNVCTRMHTEDKRSFWSCDYVHRLFGDDPGAFTIQQGNKIAYALLSAL